MAQAFRGHLVADDAVWQGSDWYMPFVIQQLPAGTAFDLTGYTVTIALHSYVGATTVAFPSAAFFDAPRTLGSGYMKILGTDTVGIEPGKYSYRLTLTPAVTSPGAQAIILYGDIELRNR